MSLLLQVLIKKLRNTFEDLMVGFVSSSFICVEVSWLVSREAFLRQETWPAVDVCSGLRQIIDWKYLQLSQLSGELRHLALWLTRFGQIHLIWSLLRITQLSSVRFCNKLYFNFLLYSVISIHRSECFSLHTKKQYSSFWEVMLWSPASVRGQRLIRHRAS